jgi:mannose-6-phosphate isomerase-like protein (cupin superfamily)
MTMINGVMAPKDIFGFYEEDGVRWYDPAPGERMAVRLSSSASNGAYTVIESIAAQGCCVPLHYHRDEAEHFVILRGTYRFVCDGRMFDAPAGTSVTIPEGVPHAWRQVSDGPGRALVVFTPGISEQFFQDIVGAPRDRIEELAARYGCFIVGPPIEA